MQDYAKRMILPLTGTDDVTFFTKPGLEVARGYVRVVIGQRGPYIEFDRRHIILESFRRIVDDTHKYYVEYRSMCAGNVKLYYQLLTVGYADYRLHKFYMSPFDLVSDKWTVLVAPLDPKPEGSIQHSIWGEISL